MMKSILFKAWMAVLPFRVESSLFTISDERVRTLDISPVLGRGYSVMTNAFHSTCLVVEEVTTPSYNYDCEFMYFHVFYFMPRCKALLVKSGSIFLETFITNLHPSSNFPKITLLISLVHQIEKQHYQAKFLVPFLPLVYTQHHSHQPRAHLR